MSYFLLALETNYTMNVTHFNELSSYLPKIKLSPLSLLLLIHWQVYKFVQVVF